jgi:serine phosphatase RsbU (regulator of sigma subunit)
MSPEFLKEKYAFVKQKNGILRAETYVPNLKGRERYLIGMATALNTLKGHYLGAIEVIHDITHNKRAQEAIEKHQKEITDSIQYASRIQKAVLPNKDILRELLDDHFLFFKPRNIVSGDFYWTKRIGNKLIVAIADCTGHGVPGAFVSLLGISFLNEITLNEEDLKSNEILEKLRGKVKISLNQDNNTNERKDGMDIALAIIDLTTYETQFSGANNPLYIFRPDEENKYNLIVLKGDRQPIGVYLKEKSFTMQECKLKKNDVIYLFTDGYADQFGHEGREKFKYSRFKNLLQEISPLPMSEQEQIIADKHIEWKGTCFQLDDILILGIRV